MKAGFQRLCGRDALDYARYRRADNDLMRAARQQDLLRAAKEQVSTGRLISRHERLIEIFADATRTDRDLATTNGLLGVLKLGLYSAERPVRQVRFPGRFLHDDATGADFVVASDAAVARAVRRFLHTPPAQAAQAARPGFEPRAERPKLRGAGLVAAPDVRVRRRPGFPLRRPRRITPGGDYDGPVRTYTVRDRAGRPHAAYRLVVAENRREGRYYGVQGTEWRFPPLLAHPTEVRRVRGRRLELFETGGRLRFVAWRTDRGVYWIANTLDLHLRNDQMLALAASLGA